MPTPADTLNADGVNSPTPFVKGCSSISSMSAEENVLLLPTKEPSVLTFLLTMR